MVPYTNITVLDERLNGQVCTGTIANETKRF